MAQTPRGVRATGEAPARRLRRQERREQILAAATRAFTRAGGFGPTNLDDVAEEAGVTRMILYRHFDSKTDLYGAVIDRAAAGLHAAAITDGQLDESSVPRMLAWASGASDEFRLLFHHAAREADFRSGIDDLRASMAAAVRPHLERTVSDGAWADWAAQLATTVTVEAIMAWLDAGQPDPDQAPRRVLTAVDGVYRAVGAS